MESALESEVKPSLLMLNDDVLMKIFTFLKLDDAINLGKCFARLGDLAQMSYTKYKTYKLNGNIPMDQIDRIFSNIGPQVLSLEIYCYNPNRDDYRRSVNVNKIITHCNNIKRLVISYWKNDGKNGTVNNTNVMSSLEELKLLDCDFGSPVGSLENFRKLLKMLDCDFGSRDFLGGFRNLKYFSASCCRGIDFKNVFENNTEIETFSLYANNTFLPDLKLLPRLNRLCLCLNDIEIQELYSLLQLPALTKLKLCCRDNILKNFLFELAARDTLEELEIEINVDDNFLNMLSLFKKLQLLIINARAPYQLKSSISWPTGIKALQLIDFKLTYDGFISMIEKLKNLQYIDLGYCAIFDECHRIYFSDVTKTGQQILNIFDTDDRQHKLDILLPRSLALQGNDFLKYEFHSDRLRIYTDCSIVRKHSQKFQNTSFIALTILGLAIL